MTPPTEFPPTPALVVGDVSHARLEPVRHTFRTAHYQWLVDLDDLPDLGPVFRPLTRFDPRDHLESGTHGSGIKGDAVAALRKFGVECAADDRVLMLSHARVLGHVFNPLTVFWCIDSADGVKGVLLEVHNTYGERHCYFVEPDERGRATVEKNFRVSPFNDLSGIYDVSIHADENEISVAIGLTRSGSRFFSAGVRGEVVPATRASLARTAARHLLITQKVSLLIRLHGIRLWLAGLPVLARNPNRTKEAR